MGGRERERGGLDFRKKKEKQVMEGVWGKVGQEVLLRFCPFAFFAFF